MMRPFLVRNAVRGSALAALLAVMAPVGAHATELPPSGTRCDPALTAAIETGSGPFDIIVHIRLDRTLPSALEARAKVIEDAVISALDSDFKRGAGAHFDIHRIFRLQPSFSATADPESITQLLENPRVQYIEYDARWPLHTIEGLDIINADVLQFYGITGDDTAIAIIDTGIDPLHPSLGGGTIPNAKVVYGLDTADGDANPIDCIGHGTAVAAVAAGAPYQWSPTRIFGGGVAPEARIFAYKAAHDESCTELVQSAVVAAIEDTVLHRDGDDFTIAAINISAGSGSFSGPCDSKVSSYARAVDTAVEAGIAVIASSGNNGDYGTLPAPACLSNVISVGSVWDTTANDVAFCLDSECNEVCTDQGNPALSVACYTNMSPYLDLLSPSDQLTTAKQGGRTIDFGGTSGAAPYVTGAVALLHDALSILDPVATRLRLELTGTPVYDPATGLLIPLIDLESAVDVRNVIVGESTNQALPSAAGDTISNSAWEDGHGEVGSLRVAVKVVDPEPSTLAITLIAPDGTRCLLHDQQRGTTARLDELSDLGGLFGIYPDTIEPMESLNRFANTELHGWWTLEVRRLEGVTERSGSTELLVGWALEFEPKTTPDPIPKSSQFFPTTVRSPGANDTTWSSDLRVFNPAVSQPAEIDLYFIPQRADGTLSFQQRKIAVLPRNIANIGDVLLDVFGMDLAQGQLIMQSNLNRFVVSSRISTSSSEGGTFGQMVMPRHDWDAVSENDEPMVMVHLANNENYRSNLGFSEARGRKSTVELKLFGGSDGVQIGKTLTVEINPYSNVQINNVIEKAGAGETDNVYATARVGEDSGRVMAYASIIDNHTGDAIYVPGLIARTGSSWLIPVVAKVAGQADTNWVSDLRILNRGASDAELDLHFRSARNEGENTLQRPIDIAPGQVLAVNDVVGSVFGLDEGTGSLRITSHDEATLVISSRTYNLVESGTYGQFIPALQTGLNGASTLIHLDKSPTRRSNIGLCETSGNPLTLVIELRNASNVLLGESATIELSPNELYQINDVFRFLNAPSAPNARVDIHPIGGTGSYAGYASIIDSTTGDAIFIPSQAIPDN